ncbi:MAG: agmatinase [Clostridiales bacterium]|nr:agmatinase [Clostridiales bacterium]
MHYKPIDSTVVPRFAEVKTFMRLPNLKTTEGIDYAVIGIPFDTGTSYRSGARFGPSAIREISSLIKPYNMPQRANVAELLSGVDYGDVPVIPGYIEETYDKIEETLLPLMQKGITPVCMGGDHSVTLGELRAAAKVHGPVALVHFDSHFDTIDAYFGKKYNHGTVFRRAQEENLVDTSHSIQIGMRGTFYSEEDRLGSEKLGFEVITGFEMLDIGINETIKRIAKRTGAKKAFCSFDIDFVDPAFAPGTGTIEAGGLSSAEALRIVRSLTGTDFVGFDLVEVLPAYDPSQITSFLAANIMFEFISLLAVKARASK